MKRSHRELSIDVVIHRVISKNNQTAPLPALTLVYRHTQNRD